jgi:endonuclease/exonuclease/phosphatase family metal-dependent hydrolase
MNALSKLYTFIFLFIALACTQINRFQGSVFPNDYTNPVKDTLKVLTWNVEHFIDEYDNPYIKNNMEDKFKTEAINKRIDLLANNLAKINADIVVLEEFESRALAMRIIKEKLGKMGYKFIVGNESPDWYMNVIVISRVPLGVTYSYGSIYTPVLGLKDSLGRIESQNNINTRMISVDAQVSPSFTLTLTGLHLKAGRYDRDVAMRKGQIQLLHAQFQRFLKEDKNTNLLVMGDLNCTPESEEFKYLLSGHQKVKFIDPLANANIFSHPSENPQRRIDHILVNPPLAKRLIANGVKIAEGLDKQELKEISDHLPVTAKFLVK